MSKHRQLEWVRPPRQARSQQTLERLLDAAEAIIDDKGIDNATVAEIAKRAGSSVGAFYTRFADKEALMRCVVERFHEQAVATAKAVLQPERWVEVSVESALESMMLFMLRVLHERRRLIVGMLVRAARDPSIGALGHRLHEHIAAHMHDLIEHRGHVMSHPNPETAVNVAVWMVLSAMESRVLYRTADGPQIPDRQAAAEIARMVVSYVGLDIADDMAPHSGARAAGH